jgi:hypothetical protein
VAADTDEQAAELPVLLFTYDPLTMDDVYGSGLDETTTAQVKALLNDPAIFDVLEGQRLLQVGPRPACVWVRAPVVHLTDTPLSAHVSCRVVQLMKEQLAHKLVSELEARHKEVLQAMQRQAEQAQAQAGGSNVGVGALLGDWASRLEACRAEKAALVGDVALGLRQLQEAQQAVLAQAGVPRVRVSSDAAEVMEQRKVLRVMVANMQLYRHHERITPPSTATATDGTQAAEGGEGQDHGQGRGGKQRAARRGAGAQGGRKAGGGAGRQQEASQGPVDKRDLISRLLKVYHTPTASDQPAPV